MFAIVAQCLKQYSARRAVAGHLVWLEVEDDQFGRVDVFSCATTQAHHYYYFFQPRDTPTRHTDRVGANLVVVVVVVVAVDFGCCLPPNAGVEHQRWAHQNL